MIIATQNVYYQNRMFKPQEPLPCYDTKMVEAWLKSGVAKDTDKEQKTAPIVSEVKVETKVEQKKDNKQVKVKTRSRR